LKENRNLNIRYPEVFIFKTSFTQDILSSPLHSPEGAA
jgi:hypothetical protein